MESAFELRARRQRGLVERRAASLGALDPCSLTIRFMMLNRRGAAGDDGELAREAFQVQLAHDAVPTLLDQEGSRAGFQLLFDQLELALRESEPLDVVLAGRLVVG